MEEQLKNWLIGKLTQGVEVTQQFPCQYDSANGFGYQIVIEGPDRQRYALILTRKTEADPFVIHQVNKVNWNKAEDEEIHVEGLKHREMTLERRDAQKYWSDSSMLAITGRLYLKWRRRPRMGPFSLLKKRDNSHKNHSKILKKKPNNDILSKV